MLTALAERPTPRAGPSRPDLDQPPDGRPQAATGWPLLATPVPAGFPSPADDHVERCLSLDEHLIRQPAATFLMRASGDCWAAAGVRDGEWTRRYCNPAP